MSTDPLPTTGPTAKPARLASWLTLAMDQALATLDNRPTGQLAEIPESQNGSGDNPENDPPRNIPEPATSAPLADADSPAAGISHEAPEPPIDLPTTEPRPTIQRTSCATVDVCDVITTMAALAEVELVSIGTSDTTVASAGAVETRQAQTAELSSTAALVVGEWVAAEAEAHESAIRARELASQQPVMAVVVEPSPQEIEPRVHGLDAAVSTGVEVIGPDVTNCLVLPAAANEASYSSEASLYVGQLRTLLLIDALREAEALAAEQLALTLPVVEASVLEAELRHAEQATATAISNELPQNQVQEASHPQEAVASLLASKLPEEFREELPAGDSAGDTTATEAEETALASEAVPQMVSESRPTIAEETESVSWVIALDDDQDTETSPDLPVAEPTQLKTPTTDLPTAAISSTPGPTVRPPRPPVVMKPIIAKEITTTSDDKVASSIHALADIDYVATSVRPTFDERDLEDDAGQASPNGERTAPGKTRRRRRTSSRSPERSSPLQRLSGLRAARAAGPIPASNAGDAFQVERIPSGLSNVDQAAPLRRPRLAMVALLVMVATTALLFWPANRRWKERYSAAAARAEQYEQWSTAVVCFQRLAVVDDRMEIRYRLARALDRAGETDQALAMMSRLAQRGSGFLPAHYWVAKHLLDAGPVNLEQARVVQSHLMRVVYSKPAGSLTAAAPRDRRPESGDNSAETVSAAEPISVELTAAEFADARQRLAMLLHATGQRTEAIPLLREATANEPALRLVLADALASQKQPDQARIEAESMRRDLLDEIKRDPFNQPVRLQLAHCEAYLENFTAAIDLLTVVRSALTLERQDVGATSKSTDVERRWNEVQDLLASVYVAWARSIKPTGSAPNRAELLGRALEIRAWHADAIRGLLMLSDPTPVEKTTIHRLVNQFESAETPAAVLFGLGAWAEQAGEVERSRRYYRQAVEKDPRQIAAANNLAWSLATVEPRDLNAALELIDSALQRYPNQINMLDTRGTIYYHLGRWSHAVEDLGALVLHGQATPERHKLLAECYDRLAKPDLAARHRSLMKEALDAAPDR